MIEVISYTVPDNVYDPCSMKLVEKKGDVVVSHGVDTESGRNVILPCEPYQQFVRLHCRVVNGVAYLRED